MESALFAMVAALFVAMLGSVYEQRREGAKTREKLENKLDENTEALRELAARTTVLEASHRHLRDGFTELRHDFSEHRRVTDKNHAEVTGSLADARERLARIEGYLRINPPSTDSEPDN